jgi:PAS domain S-box-containing protein
VRKRKQRLRRGVRRPVARAAVLRRSFSLLRATIDSTADGILVVDRAGRIAVYNRRFAEMWGIPRDLAVGSEDLSAISLVRDRIKNPEAFLARVHALYAMPEAESFDVVELVDGRIFERYSQPQRISGRCVGRVWSFRDVTERRRAEAERDGLLALEQEARALAERAVAARDEFFAAASHELKTPLTSLLLATTHLLRAAQRVGGGAREALAPALGVVERQSRRLAALADTLLDVSRLSAGRLDLEREPVDLAEVARRAAADLRDEAAASGSTVHLCDAPPVAGFWDRARILQAARAMVGNALKYGGGQPVRVTWAREDDEALLVVRDAGVGIDPAALGRIFERYERASSIHHYGGLGLGLYFVRRIAEAHGGSVAVESERGVGSKFTLRLPLEDDPHAAGRAAPS